MDKIKHISDGVNTWDVGGGTEVFTDPIVDSTFEGTEATITST